MNDDETPSVNPEEEHKENPTNLGDASKNVEYPPSQTTPPAPSTQSFDRSAIPPVSPSSGTASKPAPIRGTALAATIVATLLLGGALGGGVGASLASGRATSDASAAISSTEEVGSSSSSSSSSDSSYLDSALTAVVSISALSGTESGLGSGVVLNSQGYIVTNAHVVTLEGATTNAKLTVETSSGDVRDATLVAYDSTSDLAVIKVDDASGLTPITFADSDNLEIGQTTTAIGSPLELSNTVTTGIVSSVNRAITLASSAVEEDTSDDDNYYYFANPTDPNYELQSQETTTASTISLNVIQTDAAINSGNSGGALLDSNGNLIGINVAIATGDSSTGSTTASGSIGVGFAIPSNYVKRAAEELIETGKVSHGYLGASVKSSTVTDSVFTEGAQVESVVSGSPADKAGLSAGDVVVSFDGKTVTDSTTLVAYVRATPSDTTVTLGLDDGSTVKVTLGEAS